jgi:hypothetical protein
MAAQAVDPDVLLSDLIELRDGLRRLEAEHALSDEQARAIRGLVAEIDAITIAASGELSASDAELERLTAAAWRVKQALEAE